MQTKDPRDRKAIPFRSIPSKRPTRWSHERTKLIVESRATGASFGLIASDLGEGFTSSAVIKRAYRVEIRIKGRWIRLIDAFPHCSFRKKRTPTVWVNCRVELLKKLRADGYSASQIAAKLNVTRNAVLGEVHRLGLPGRASTKCVAKVSMKPRVMRVFHEFGHAPNGVSILDVRENMCRWPIGDPMQPGFHLCGRSKTTSGPYCAHHAAIRMRNHQ